MWLRSWDKLTAFSQGGIATKHYPENPIPNKKKNPKNLGTITNKLEPVKPVKIAEKKKKPEKN